VPPFNQQVEAMLAVKNINQAAANEEALDATITASYMNDVVETSTVAAPTCCSPVEVDILKIFTTPVEVDTRAIAWSPDRQVTITTTYPPPPPPPPPPTTTTTTTITTTTITTAALGVIMGGNLRR